MNSVFLLIASAMFLSLSFVIALYRIRKTSRQINFFGPPIEYSINTKRLLCWLFFIPGIIAAGFDHVSFVPVVMFLGYAITSISLKRGNAEKSIAIAFVAGLFYCLLFNAAVFAHSGIIFIASLVTTGAIFVALGKTTQPRFARYF